MAEKSNAPIVIYEGKGGKMRLRADVDRETVWATQSQIAELFGIDRTVATRHIKNILASTEVSRESNVQKMHIAHSDKPVSYYSLDLILAVGYRANSARAMVFRVWATKVLREYIMKGVVVNVDRIKKLHERGIDDIRQKIQFIQDTVRRRTLDQVEVDGLLSVINGYASSWFLLYRYDEGDVTVRRSNGKGTKKFEYGFVRPAIDELKRSLVAKYEASDLFAHERDESFKGILQTIYQSFDGKEFYAGLEEKAAHLLYFVIKDHPFSDGNKRVGSFLFVLFLQLNGILHRADGEKKINDNALVALALLVAESKPREKEQMIALITQFLA